LVGPEKRPLLFVCRSTIGGFAVGALIGSRICTALLPVSVLRIRLWLWAVLWLQQLSGLLRRTAALLLRRLLRTATLLRLLRLLAAAGERGRATTGHALGHHGTAKMDFSCLKGHRARSAGTSLGICWEQFQSQASTVKTIACSMRAE
jgi:hypothetical protein